MTSSSSVTLTVVTKNLSRVQLQAPDKSVEKVVAVPQEVLLKMNMKRVFVAAPDLV